MIHCKDCAHWGRERIDSDGTAKCPRLYVDRSKPPLIIVVGFEVDEVWTAPEFGCVMGEARPLVVTA